ncbi:hypothetical protein BIV25_19945 [Streptomyces sp. MUSC 14]|nr:hypothetical protein BIV25_19945 [Streptomyces sp. MUSC 14]
MHQVLPRLRDEIRAITVQAQPLMPAPSQPLPAEHQAAARLPLPAADLCWEAAAMTHAQAHGRRSSHRPRTRRLELR